MGWGAGLCGGLNDVVKGRERKDLKKKKKGKERKGEKKLGRVNVRTPGAHVLK